MPYALVHGNPETSAIWGPLVTELRARGKDDVVLLSPPGFGSPVPDGWGATMGEYREWLASELRALRGSVHVVGHDWGALHLYGVIAAYPSLVASWTADCAGILHPDYVWHDHARVWQTPDAGEQAVAAMVGAPRDDKLASLGPFGITGDVAESLADAMNDSMGRCILALYRSGAQPEMARLGDRVASAERRPGLVVVATGDTFVGTPAMATETASRLGATSFTVSAGHWWMLEQPAQTAAQLVGFWDTLGAER